MATNPVHLFGGAITAAAGGASAQTLYTNPAATTTIVTNITIANNDGVVRTITLSRVPAFGGSPGTEAQANRFVAAIQLEPNEVQVISDLRLVLSSQNDTIKAFASSASSINVFISGVTEV